MSRRLPSLIRHSPVKRLEIAPGFIAALCLLRLLVFPLAILLLRLTPLSRTVVDALYLCTAMPCAALTAMQADLFDCDTELASRGVAVSTALSLITVPLMLMLI